MRWLAAAVLLTVSLNLSARDFPVVVIETSLGDITIQLEHRRAPITVQNFLGYVERGDYDGTIFHRVIPGFMVQGGGFHPDMTLRPEGQMIRNEADNGLNNIQGTVAMARTSAIDSASNQFFINVDNNLHLNHKPTSCTREQVASVEAAREKGLFKPLSCDSFGYAVFGQVIDGMDVVRAIEIVETSSKDGHDDVPVDPVIIETVRVVSR